jgi:ankyrin repeat protein
MKQNYDDYDPTVVNFMALFGVDKINDLKSFIKNLGIDRKSEFLHHAVAANLNFDFINWLIQNGANVNFKFRNETVLMASFRNPKIMKLLLKNGANIEEQNKEKETALFFAIKFNNLESVKILIDNGANVNALTVFDNIYSSKTPLVYAKRYASREIIDLLIKHGAKDGPADPEKVQAWIDEGPLDL